MYDNVQPDKKWEFNAEVADVFDNMLERSIPQYEIMRKAVTDIACNFAIQNTTIVDLGCSRGSALDPIIKRRGRLNDYVGVDVSDPMLGAARERFADREEHIIIENCDLRTTYPTDMIFGGASRHASVTLSVLTLQFTPMEYRQRILRDVWRSTVNGGVFILVEKVLGDTADINKFMVDNYYELKSENGYSQEQIERKRLSLEGVLVPVTARWNEELLYSAGFVQVDCFWRWMNFAGWLAIKGD